MTSIVEKLTSLGIKPLGGNVFEPLSDDEVVRIEQAVGTQLPKTYKQFLMRFGGSMFSGEVNCTPSTKPLFFGWFYGFSELATAIDCLKETLPETIIPFGDDSGDIVFCLGVAGEDEGKVFVHNNTFGWHADAEAYLERGEPVPPDIRYQVVEEIAPSFEVLIKNMEKNEESI